MKLRSIASLILLICISLLLSTQSISARILPPVIFKSYEAFGDLQSKGLASRTRISTGASKSDHLIIEARETQVGFSIGNLFAFAVSQQEYYKALISSGDIVDRPTDITLHIIILNYLGYPANSLRISYKYDLPSSSWNKIESVTSDKCDVIGQFPDYAITELFRTTGFLASNPGLFPINHDLTNKEAVMGLVSAASMGISRPPQINDFIWGLLKKGAETFIDDSSWPSELRRGVSFELEHIHFDNENLKQSYYDIGKIEWNEHCPSPPVPPTSITIN